MKIQGLMMLVAVMGIFVTGSHGFAKNNDLPQEEEAALLKKMKKAVRKENSWDFYEAAIKYRETVTARNWKRRAEASETIAEMASDIKYPLAAYRLSVSGICSSIQVPSPDKLLSDNELKTRKSTIFYDNDDALKTLLPQFLIQAISSDAEYLLWVMCAYSGGIDKEPIFKTLESLYGEQYPQSAYLEFRRLKTSFPNSENIWPEFAEKYEGKAMGLFAEAELLKMKLSELRSSGADSDEFRKLRKACEDVEKRRKNFTGDEARLVADLQSVRKMAAEMDAPGLRAKADHDSLMIYLKNADKVEVQVLAADKTVFTAEENNEKKSYYVTDTLVIVLPELNDGEYKVVCRSGDMDLSFQMERNTVSVAGRFSKEGFAVYAADYISGRPVQKADISVTLRGEEVWSAKDFTFEGFTYLPGDFAEKAATDEYYVLTCSYKDDNGLFHESRELRFNPIRRIISDVQDRTLSAWMYLDNAAFHPGDEVRFKAVVGQINSGAAGDRSTVDAGNEVTAALYDSENKIVSKQMLVTNEYGSVAGTFALPADRRNGTFRIEISMDGKRLKTAYLTVDNFRLPDFAITFEPVNEIYFPGDSVRVRGMIKSWSGRPTAYASVTYRIKKFWNEVYASGEVVLDEGGNFEIVFKSQPSEKSLDKVYDNYNIELKFTDATGETLAKSTNVVISDLTLMTDVKNRAEVGSQAAPMRNDRAEIIVAEGNKAEFSFELFNRNYLSLPAAVSYSITKDGKVLDKGSAATEELIVKDLSAYGPGTFSIDAEVDVRGEKRNCSIKIIVTNPGDEALYADVEYYYKVLKGEKIAAQFGATAGPVWAIVQLQGCDGSILLEEMVHIDAKAGERGSLRTLEYDYLPEYPEEVRMEIFYFRNDGWQTMSYDFGRESLKPEYPLYFSRFTEKAFSGDVCHYEITAWPGAECTVSVFDKTTETFRSNPWTVFQMRSESREYAYVNSRAGSVKGWGQYRGGDVSEDEAIPFQLVSSSAPRSKANIVTDLMGSDMTAENAVLSMGAGTGGSDAQSVDIRSEFKKVLYFNPFLAADENGLVEFSFTAGDKLSQWAVAVLAHDKQLNSRVLRKTMQISLPVQLSVMQPDFLYSGDKYSLAFALSNLTSGDSEGVVSLSVYNGTEYKNAEPILVKEKACRVGANRSVGESFMLDVPAGVDVLGLKLVYRSAAGYSDGVFVTVPVYKPVQTLREAHSAVLRPGMDRDSLIAVLRRQFVNMSGETAAVNQIVLADMLRKSIPETVQADGKDVVSVSGALLAEALSAKLLGREPEKLSELCSELLLYRNSDGGFGWFKGASSSPVMTAMVLERLALLRDNSLIDNQLYLDEEIEKSIFYLDNYFFSSEQYPLWGGGISLEQYLRLRATYGGFGLSVDLTKAERKAFLASVKDYFFGSERLERPGYILAKARRISALMSFMSEDNAFAASVGFRNNAKARKAVKRYMESLKEYAVEHSSGGVYYPNAVLPWRGLLESEVYAHSLICDLMARFDELYGDAECAEIAEGIRLWIMVQKETQDWASDSGYLLAINSVMEGSEALMDAEIVVVSSEEEVAFGDVLAAGNGMKVNCTYYIYIGESGVSDGSSASSGAVSEYPGYRRIVDGETLSVGDKVLAVYELWSEENRSFVKFTAPRHACLRPERQLSGYAGLGLGPLRVSGFRMVMPYAYREVRADATVFYFNVLPEENVKVAETLFVTQAGTFSCAAPAVECVYAPHYGANSECANIFNIN